MTFKYNAASADRSHNQEVLHQDIKTALQHSMPHSFEISANNIKTRMEGAALMGRKDGRASPLSVLDVAQVLLEPMSKPSPIKTPNQTLTSRDKAREKSGNLVSTPSSPTPRHIAKAKAIEADLEAATTTRLLHTSSEKRLKEALHVSEKKRSMSTSMVSGLAYCVSSCGMILLNKMALSSFGWQAQISLMLYQNLICVLVVYALKLLGLIQTEPLTPRLCRAWLPVNLIFIGMLATSFWSLQYIQVAMVTILKNATNLLTAVGEMYLFNKVHSAGVWASLFLMIVSAVCGGFTDLSFHAVGYFWQTINCLFTAAYSLVLRKIMDVAKKETKSGQLSELSMVLLNNTLSIPLGLALVLFFGEATYLWSTPLIRSPAFMAVATLSGLFGMSISFTSMWFLQQTGPTTYSLVGSLNKIPLSVAGIVLFNAPTSLYNMLSILFGCGAGVMFARAKMMQK